MGRLRGEGVRESGNQGVRESGSQGVRESGNQGIRESGSQGVRGSGSQGVRESGSQGVRESGSQGMIGYRPEMRNKTFHDLIVWQQGVDLAEAVYRATESFPRSEDYALKSQMRLAASSVPSNIAEGS